MRLKEMWGIDNVVSVPLLAEISKCGDTGAPYVLSYPDSDASKSILEVAKGVVNEISRLSTGNSLQNNISYDDITDTFKFRDQKVSTLSLRADCRCAVCVEEFTGKPLLIKEDIPINIRPLSMAPIGRYAISIDWSDGHKSLYPFRQIEKL
jgi:DUF971 family protein